MKGQVYNKQYIFIYLGMVIAILSIWNTYIYISTISHISLSVDSCIAYTTRKNIERMIYTAYAQSKPDAQTIRMLIKKQFLCIKSVSIAYQPPNLVHITCKARKPYCLLNYDFVLTAEAIPIYKKAFKPHELERLHRIMLNAQLLSNKAILKACKQCIAVLPDRIFDQFNVDWKNAVEVWLHDKKNNFSVIFDMHNPPDITLIAQCAAAVKNELQEKEILQLKHNQWIVDIRFANQIIVNKGVRGNYG